MLYIDRVILHNFKSFKHANIQLSRGFNCIAGPNGSGKSNICDALLFAMGETSLKRMRVNNAAGLISDGAPKKDDGLRTYVKIVFGGDRELSVMRGLKSDKIIYKVDGDRVKRQDMIDALRENGCDINDTNTITQGEVSHLLSLNPRERRELIDIAAGIQEFEIKKADALKELDRVENRLTNAQILVNERAGFLSELKKEKEQAEEYNKLSIYLKQLNYTLLKMRERELTKQYDNVIGNCNANKKDIEELETKIDEIDKNLGHITVEKDALVKKLNESSIDANASNRLIEQLNKNIAIKESQIEGIRSSRMRLTSEKIKLWDELNQIKKHMTENDERIKNMEIELNKELKSAPQEEIFSDDESEHDISLDYDKLQGHVEELRILIDSLEKDISQIGFERTTTENVLTTHLFTIETKKRVIAEKTEVFNKALEKINEQNIKKRELLSALLVTNQELKKIEDERNKLFSEQVELREQLMISNTGSDKIGKYLKENLKEGFYGRAAELCDYEDKYAKAISAAAGSRINFFVVDSIAIADKAIDILKKRGLGRATFIPLKEVRLSKKEVLPNLTELISHINFEPKFNKAFTYIFTNTYIISSVNDSKKHGLGMARYVTLDGELIEPSGIVSGGNIKGNISERVIAAKLKSVDQLLSEIVLKINAQLTIEQKTKKELSEIESYILKSTVEMDYLKKEIDISKIEIKKIEDEVEKVNTKFVDLAKMIHKIEEEKQNVQEQYNQQKTKAQHMYDNIMKFASEGRKNKRNREDVQKAKEIRERIDVIRVSIAEAKKENAMMNQRVDAITKNIKEQSIELKEIDTEEAQIVEVIGLNTKELNSLKDKMNTYDKATRSIYERISEYDKHIAQISSEKGKLAMSIERTNRNLMENEMNKAQLEVRIGDIRAELPSYQKLEEISNMDIYGLENETSRTKIKLEGMGSINLKAPEMYEQKSRDVSEAEKKLSTVQNERDAILEMITQIDSKKINIFNETLDAVNKNFKELYSYIFPGSAELCIDNPKEVFNSGLNIHATINKKKTLIDRFSGGQKSLTMLLLIFAIQMRRAMAFYIFDEIDAALDKENSKKLSMLIKEMSKRSQFVVVSHNDSMIVGSQTNIGVVMQSGESKAVGIAFSEEKQQLV